MYAVAIIILQKEKCTFWTIEILYWELLSIFYFALCSFEEEMFFSFYYSLSLPLVLHLSANPSYQKNKKSHKVIIVAIVWDYDFEEILIYAVASFQKTLNTYNGKGQQWRAHFMLYANVNLFIVIRLFVYKSFQCAI